MRRSAAFAALFVALASILFAPWRLSAGEPARDAPPRFTFSDADGRNLSTDDFIGKVVLLDFWASWCMPCREEMPQFDQLQERWGTKGFVVVPVAIDARGLPAVDAFYAERNIAHLGKFLDPSREAAKRLGFIGLPSALLLDRRGKVAARIEGPINWQSARISTLIEKLLGE